MTTTKLELQQTNARLARENEELRTRVAQLEGDIVRIASVASAINTVNDARPQWQKDRAAAMAAAKDMAARTRMVVKACSEPRCAAPDAHCNGACHGVWPDGSPR